MGRFETFLCLILLFIFIYGIDILANAHACKAKSVSFDNHNYGPIQGCLVLHNGRWLPLENIRGFDSNN